MKRVTYLLNYSHSCKTFVYDPLTMFALSASDFFFTSKELMKW